jgi:hypothetical protein
MKCELYFYELPFAAGEEISWNDVVVKGKGILYIVNTLVFAGETEKIRKYMF